MARRPLSLLLSTLLLTGSSAWAAVAGHVQGVAIDDKVLVDGLPAVLKGAGLKQRFGLDTDVMARYLPRKVHGLAAATALDGAKRLRFVMLVPLKERQLERTFTQSATRTLTPLELGALTDDIMAIGRAYEVGRRQAGRCDRHRLDTRPRPRGRHQWPMRVNVRKAHWGFPAEVRGWPEI